jgi:colicin import membrane protein
VSTAVFEERIDPGRTASALLSLGMHLLLVAVLVFGVRWQNKPPETVQIELWESPRPQPVVEPPKAVEPPKPVEAPKPEPKIEKPAIVEKAPPPKVEKKPEPKPVAKVEPLKPRVDEAQKRMNEQLAREQAALAVDRERDRMREQLASEAKTASARQMADWMDKVSAKVRGNMVLPQGVAGNPEALFDVVQLPNGEVLSVKLRKSSGHAALDEAIERAILKSSPLPKPDSKEAPPRSFVLRYRPLDRL